MNSHRKAEKKILSIIVALMMVLTAVPLSFADEIDSEGTGQDTSAEAVQEDEAAVQEDDSVSNSQLQEPQGAAVEVAEEKPASDKQEETSEPMTKEQEASTSLPVKKVTKNAASSNAESSSEGTKTFEDGTYIPDAFAFIGGTGKATMTCEKVIIKDGAPTAVFVASSENFTHIYMGVAPSNNETPSLYDPTTGTRGKDVYPISEKRVSVPVVLNEEKPVAVRTVAMTAPHWVNYKYKITLNQDKESESSDTTIPENKENVAPSGNQNKKDSKTSVEPAKKGTLADGTYKVKATTDRKMFYLYPKEKDPAEVLLVKKNNKMTATITLSGQGYDYVYMGTPAQAKKAKKSKWIKAKVKNGYYTFVIPVSKLDKKLAITPHSRKYASDGDSSTEPWRPDKWIIFYSAGAKKVKSGTKASVPKKKNSSREAKAAAKSKKKKVSKKADKVSRWKDDSGKSTSSVNSSTVLKDGVYQPDNFSWSGGSGRLAYIRCNKITIKGGQAYANIEFGSTKYDSLKANGRVYSKQGGGNSVFVIPVKLNANNTIIGRTTAMSQPHWIKYNIFIVLDEGSAKSSRESSDDEKKSESKKTLTEKAPALMGLKFKEKVEVKYAKYFKIFRYDKGFTLIEIDQGSDTWLEKGSNNKKSGKSDEPEYDDDGKLIAKSANEITNEIYQNNIVYYLVAPKGAEIPAGLEKECIIIEQDVDRTCTMSPEALKHLFSLGLLDKVSMVSMDKDRIKIKEVNEKIEAKEIFFGGTAKKPPYKDIVTNKIDIALFSGDILPEKTDEESGKENTNDQLLELRTLQKRFSALDTPMIIDRSSQESNNYADAEWVKVYGSIFGEEEKADSCFKEYVKEHKKVKKD